jgi:Outer membrane protein beta-barrel domain/Domain of unknown function (DUF6265)
LHKNNQCSMKLNIITALLTALLPFSLIAQVEDPEAAFDELKSMEGVWFMPDDRGDRLEVWEILNDSTMAGKDLRIKADGGDTILLETLSLTLRDTNILYSVKVRGQNANKIIDFKLTDAFNGSFVFENPKHDDPQKITYLLLDNREIQVTTEGKRNNRPVTTEFIFEREFNPTSTEIRLHAGTGASNFYAERDFNNITQSPEFGWRPNWDLGVSTAFKGRGGFLTLHVELGLAGRFSSVQSEFFDDTIRYVRSGGYRTTWFTAAVYPEFTLRRDGRFSLIVGPYYGRLLLARATGTVIPESDSKTFSVNNDFNKSDFGILAGAQYHLKAKKKDRGSIIGIRYQHGLRDLDNLYKRRCTNPSLCNERLLLRSVSVYYSVNLLQL